MIIRNLVKNLINYLFLQIIIQVILKVYFQVHGFIRHQIQENEFKKIIVNHWINRPEIMYIVFVFLKIGKIIWSISGQYWI